MSQLADLYITLTKPPADSPPNVIASIALRYASLNHAGDLLTDPLIPKERNDLRWYLEEYWKWPYYEFVQRARQVEALLPELGKRLYHAVFGSHEADRIVQRWLSNTKGQLQISIVSDIPKVLSLPWELLHTERGFMVLRTGHPVSIVRCLPQSELSEISTSFKPPLRILLVTARPEGTGFVDPRSIARELVDEVQGQVESGMIELELLRPPTLSALRNRLKDIKRPIHGLHFDGHGTFDEEIGINDELQLSGGGQGKLAFENAEGQLHEVEAGEVAQVLHDSGVRLAVLTACQSAMSASDDAFSSVAARLIRGGVDAVVAMSTSVLVASATRYAETFYRELAAGTPVPVVQERARQALHDSPQRHLLRRRRDEEGKPVELRDWWLPHFYQQRPLKLQPSKPRRRDKEPLRILSSNLLEGGMPVEPRYGFNGRAYELLQIERWLIRGKMVVIQGFGGVGKTALAREAADWLTRTKMYEGACFVSFEHGGDATTLLSALGNYLEVNDGNYNPNESKTALARLQPILKEKSALVIADNLESILPGGEAPLEVGVRTQFWDVLLELARMGAGVLLTSRDTAFGDGRLAPGDRVAYLALDGLDPEDAYSLAIRLLNSLGIDRKRAPYAEVRDLLIQIDHHPLAIQLVLPALHEFPLSTIKSDFATLLPKFVDDTENGHNRSLLASLDYSLQRLSAKQRKLLPHLALFEGGASEDNVLEITQVAETERMKLRSALEQAALLMAEQVHESDPIPFLRFHPVLIPFLRSQTGAGDAELRERYVRRYLSLAKYLYNQDDHNPQATRALVQLELPNLRRALEILLESGDNEATSEMAACIISFLNYSGRVRERNELRHQVAESIAATGTHGGGTLTGGEYLHESGLGIDEGKKGNMRAALSRFANLLARIESMPEGTPLGRGPSEHYQTLGHLAGCLIDSGQYVAAEERIRKAQAINDALIRHHPGEQSFADERNTLLNALAEALLGQGKYPQAQKVSEELLKAAEQQVDLRSQATALERLGTLALKQQNYAKAEAYCTAAFECFRSLGEPIAEANLWEKLGVVAIERKEWTEAERYLRESLKIKERLDNEAGSASICSNLGLVAKERGHPTEAESWFIRALEFGERVQPDGPLHANILNNLAFLLLSEVREGHPSVARLADARDYAERALVIM